MWTIITFIIFGIIIFIGMKIDSSDTIINSAVEDRNNGIIGKVDAQYFGGFKDICNCNKCYVIRKENDIEFNFLSKNGTNPNIKIISNKNIKSCSIMTDIQIQEQVNLGKLLCFGLLAFGMKGNKKEITNEYVVLEVLDNNSLISVILKNKENNQKLLDMFMFVNYQ